MNNFPTNQERDLLHSRSYGKERREFLLKFLHKYGKIYVNRRYQLQTKQDKDLMWLIKKGKIKLTRTHNFSCFATKYATKRSAQGQTLVVLAH